MKHKYSLFYDMLDCISNFSKHVYNRTEVYEIFCNYILEVTDEDKNVDHEGRLVDIKGKNIYIVLAEAIVDFCNFRMNKSELFNIVLTCVVTSTNKDKEEILEKRYIGQTQYQRSKFWLSKK